nr:uncharacterized protein LOC127344410 [Lolium perenne]
MADSDGDGAAHEGAWGAGSASSFTLILHHHLHREQRHLRFAQPSFKPLPFTLFLKAAKVVLDQHKPGTDWFVFMPYCILERLSLSSSPQLLQMRSSRPLLVFDTMARHAFAYAGYILS